MNVYDFDGTIYSGDSSADLFLFEAKRRPLSVLKRAPGLLAAFAGYKLKKRTIEEFKGRFFSFLKDVPDVNKELEIFWRSHLKKIRDWYLKAKKPDDVIISASPRFLLETPCRELGIGSLIASEVNEKTGEFRSKNCKGAEKVSRFRAEFPTGMIDEFYSDSRSDEPMAKEAAKAFLIKKGKIEKWK